MCVPHGDIVCTHAEEETAFFIALRTAIFEQGVGAAGTRMQAVAGVLIKPAVFYNDIPAHLKA